MANQRESVEASESEVAVHWKEEEYFYPPRDFIAQANMTDKKVYERFSLDNFPDCFKEYADMLDWYQSWHTTLDTSDAPCWKWFVGGKINACYNCVDRHLAKHRNKAALIFVPEPEEEPPVALTYQELFVRVNEFAALLVNSRASRRATGLPSTCRWSRSCRSPCSRVPGWGSSTRSCSAAFRATPAAIGWPTPRAA